MIRAMAKGEENLPEEEAPAPANAPVKVAPPPAGAPDMKVMKVYPDGTQVVVSWSDLGKDMDQGEKHGGPPKIMPYDPRGAALPVELLLRPIRLGKRVRVVYIDYRQRLGTSTMRPLQSAWWTLVRILRARFT